MDVQELLKRHVAASLERDKWAKRAIGLLALGKDRAGMAAANKARRLDERVKAFQP